MQKALLILLIVCSYTVVVSQTKLPAIFSDHMVLQRNTVASVWGTDTPNTKITLRSGWGVQQSIRSDASGKWKMEIQTPEAGGPYELVIEGSTTITLKNIMIGEVWFCSGQSNMEMPVKGFKNQPINGSNEAILNSFNNKLRLFTVKRSSASTPQEDVRGNWAEAAPVSVADFSATAFFFGKKLQEVLGVPVGLIHSSWGGTNIKCWMDKETLEGFNVKVDTTKLNDKLPGRLYNGMIHPLINYNIAGIVWYQGEGNRKEPILYKQLFPAMINLWRSKWGKKELPFYFVQIAPYEYALRKRDKELKVNSAYLREAQLDTYLNVNDTGMVVTLDIGDCNYIHPREKKIVGDRLAYWALGHTYGYQGINFRSPHYTNMKIGDDGRVRLFFDNCPNGFSTFGKKLMGFTIAGKDRVFYQAQALINDDKTISVWADKVGDPIAVRYAFENCPEATLFDISGLPLSSFRTDDWHQ